MGLADFLDKNVKKSSSKWLPRPEILLCPNTPKPMHGVVPRIILGKTWWDKTRDEAYRSTDYHCIACGVHKYIAKKRQWLEGHEIYDVDYAKGKWIYIETVPLCHYCHSYIHSGRLEVLFKTDKMSYDEYRSIINHGDGVLARNNLSKTKPYSGRSARWDKWRLLLNDEEYPPIYKTFKEWKDAFK